MSETEFDVSPTFCVLPWLHIATWTDGSVSLCCVSGKDSGKNLNHSTISEIWNDEYWRKARIDMLNGRRVAACTRCYEQEKYQYTSHRVAENRTWEGLLGDKLRKRVLSTRGDGSLEESIIAIDLRLGNKCNLQCVMCAPSESTKWIATAEKLSRTFRSPRLALEWRAKRAIRVEKYKWYENDEFWKGLSDFLPEIQQIIVGGGEPMLIREQVRFIKECAETGAASHIVLRYHTNATVAPEELAPYWEKFRKVELFLSVDGFGPINHYVRFPADWEMIEKTMSFYDALPSNVEVQILASIHALNFYYIPDLFRYFRRKGLAKARSAEGLRRFIHPGIVQDPSYLDARVLPRALKQRITRRIEELEQELGYPLPELQSVVRLMNSADHSRLLKTLRHYCNALDKARGTDFNATFSEIKNDLFG